MVDEVRTPWKELSNKEKMYFVRRGITKARYEAGDVAVKEKVKPVVAPAAPLEAENKVSPEGQPAAVIDNDKPKLIKTGSKKILMIAGGAALVIAALAGFIWYLGHPEGGTILGLGSFIAIIGGGFLLYYGIKKEAGGYIVKQTQSHSSIVTKPGIVKAADGKVLAYPPNTLVIYRDRVAFEYIENPTGMRWKCHNDNKYYFVILKDKEAPKEFKLPDNDDDQRYYDPREFANVISMPLNKKYFSWVPSTVQKIALGIMAGVIVAELVGIVAIGG